MTTKTRPLEPCTCGMGYAHASNCPNCTANIRLRDAGQPHAYNRAARQNIPADQLPAVNAARLAYDDATRELARAWDRLSEEARLLGLLYVANPSQAALDGQAAVVTELRNRADAATATAQAAKAARDALLAPWGWDR